MISIITVNYNQMSVTLDLLTSLSPFDSSELEVIVVDNGSMQDDTHLITEFYPQVKVIRSESNLGFAGGNNLGIKEAKGEFLFLVNNDTVVPSATLDQLKQVLIDRPDAAIVCPLIYYYDQPDMIQYAGFTAINPLTGRNSSIHFKQKIRKSNQVLETEYAHGAAMMIRKSVVSELGMMSENFFLYYEELDWVHRIKQSGLKVLVDRKSHILHKESISTGKDSPLKTYFQTRNRILFMRRNFPTWQKMLFYTFFTLVSAPKYLIVNLIKGKTNHLRSFVAGITWNFSNPLESNNIGFIYDHIR